VIFFHPPHLYCVTTLPSKTNTTANIGVKCLHFSHNVIRMERQRTPPGPRWTIRKKEHINFIEPHMWPPNSPDINPVDYAICGVFQQRVYHQRQFNTVEYLKRAIVTEWQKLSQRFIDNSINERRRHLEAIINNGGHMEHCNLD